MKTLTLIGLAVMGLALAGCSATAPTATQVPEPTATPVSTPTATPVPEPAVTSVPTPTATPVPETATTLVPETAATLTPVEEAKEYALWGLAKYVDITDEMDEIIEDCVEGNPAVSETQLINLTLDIDNMNELERNIVAAMEGHAPWPTFGQISPGAPAGDYVDLLVEQAERILQRLYTYC